MSLQGLGEEFPLSFQFNWHHSVLCCGKPTSWVVLLCSSQSFPLLDKFSHHGCSMDLMRQAIAFFSVLASGINVSQVVSGLKSKTKTKLLHAGTAYGNLSAELGSFRGLCNWIKLLINFCNVRHECNTESLPSVKSIGGEAEVGFPVDMLPSCGERLNSFHVTFHNSQLRRRKIRFIWRIYVCVSSLLSIKRIWSSWLPASHSTSCL